VTDRKTILDKLAIVREHMARARARRPDAREAFDANAELQDALALNVLVAAQEASDIAMYITADEGWGLPGSYGEGFDLLARNQVIGAAQAHAMTQIAALRGRIAHGVAGKEPGTLWTELPAALATLDRYVEAIAKFVGV